MDARSYQKAEIQYNESKRESNLQEKIKKQTLAKSTYETVVADEKHFSLVDRQNSYLSLANIYNDQGKYDLAREQCQKAIALRDANQDQHEFEKACIKTRYFMLLATIDSSCNQVQSAKQNYLKALTYCDQAQATKYLDALMRDTSLRYQHGLELVRQNKLHEFICHVGLVGIFKSLDLDAGNHPDMVEKIYKDVDKKWDFDYFYGIYLIHKKKFLDATNHFDEKGLKAFHYDYALAYLGNDVCTHAIPKFTLAMECCTNDNDKAKCYFGRAKAYHRNSYRQDTKAAIQDIHQALKLFSDNLNKTECFSELASIYVSLNQHDDAITAYREFISHHTDGFQKGMAYKKCAELCEKKNDIQQAIVYFGLALPLLPPVEQEKIYRSRGLHYQSTNEDQKAIEDFTEALRLNGKKNGDLYFWRGMSNQRQKNYPLAIADLVKAREIFFGSAKDEAAYSFEIAFCYQELADHAPALENYKTAFITDPSLTAKLTDTQLRYFIKNHADYYRDTLALCLDESQKIQAQKIFASIREESKPKPQPVSEQKTNTWTDFFKPKPKTTMQDRPLTPQKSVGKKLSNLFKPSERASSSVAVPSSPELIPLTGGALTAPPPSPTHK